jgi:large subunit ribosomal protein L1
MSVDTKKLVVALEKAKQGGQRNFNQSVDLIANLKDIDMKKPGSKINELVELPHPISKAVKICVVGSGQMALEAKREGADMVLQKEELEALSKDKKAARKLAAQYDFISEASLMPTVGKTLGTFLGPRGKMPTPVPPNSPIAPALARHRRVVQVRLKDQPTVQCRVGTEEMPVDQLAENIKAVMRKLEQKLERGANNIRSIYVKTTMGEPVKVELGEATR